MDATKHEHPNKPSLGVDSRRPCWALPPAIFLLVLLLPLLPCTTAFDSLPYNYSLGNEQWGVYPHHSTVPTQYIVTNDTTLWIFNKVASRSWRQSKRAIIFTTLRLGDAPSEQVVDMISTFCYHLHRQGMLQHTMLLTTEEATWHALHARGLPVWLDRALPRRSAYVSTVIPNDTFNREFDVQKHWWGWRISSLGFRAVYMDSDVAVLKDPLAPFSNPYRYDVQGLTDWQHLPDPELRRGFTLRQHPCMLYYLRSDPFVPGESSWTEAWHANHQRQAILNPHNPCQSTGLWFVEPTEAAVAFMRAMADRIAYHAPYEWDQTAWNEVLMPFLWGAGDDPPLRYRVLPYSVASNLVTYRTRQKMNLATDVTFLHMGGVHGDAKHQELHKEGLWKPQFVVSSKQPRGGLNVWRAATEETTHGETKEGKKERSATVAVTPLGSLDAPGSNVRGQGEVLGGTVHGQRYVALGLLCGGVALGAAVFRSRRHRARNSRAHVKEFPN